MAYKIGTRGSLLALTQSALLRDQLMALSGEAFELVTIKTQGDQITDKPLWQLDGKDFFTKELDEALLAGQVDLVVHSYKDLGSERPAGIQLAAITERRFAHDVLLLKKETAEKLRSWNGVFNVGTSSPRRISCLTTSLAPYLTAREGVKVECSTLRGNVNTRIQKLRDGQYHAITLALAGLERLAEGPGSHAELARLLDGLTFMVLPLSVFPSAAAQGALAVECARERQDKGKLLNIIHRLDHPLTAEEVSRERAAFTSYGGGCHLAVGIHVRAVDGDFLHFHRGLLDQTAINVKRREGAIAAMSTVDHVFVGQGNFPGVITDRWYKKIPTGHAAPTENHHVFVTTAHALPSLTGKARTLWSAGSETHKKLVQAGHWVNGGSDGLGTPELQRLASSKALHLMMGDAPWLVLSHERATSPLGEVFPAYRQEMGVPSADDIHRLQAVTHAWWASFPQFEAYTQLVPELLLAQHFCGLGKTLTELRAHGIKAMGLTDVQEFLRLTGKA